MQSFGERFQIAEAVSAKALRRERAHASPGPERKPAWLLRHRKHRKEWNRKQLEKKEGRLPGLAAQNGTWIFLRRKPVKGFETRSSLPE